MSIPHAYAAAPDDLYRALGETAGINRIVDEMLRIVPEDGRIAASFKDTNMKRLGILIKEQFCVQSGGPCTYSGDPMRETHEQLGIRSAQFNALVEDLQLAMERCGIDAASQNRLLALLAPMKRDIVAPR
ncbi:MULTISPECIES: group 1 truncated hemoglobin [unclassified Undibacterium]|uniref:group I truncated hemoglobin n=1 Tax=unclassified Undibacterium TaxID=2630295 RepID=UPI002AC965A3|nr:MULTISPECIES: group 1 truncated hemoglobin [unclassified Undibacterium]MEB0140620.1 group 1 truncated hemoglobin [Undibacterium sp. CCC2.1]MEB0173474.1 group 1 truncated hemoglobin [Undibacterium sp. CCC1.1]MEB0177624.1 group 1 truncated hemoglobin [Undibacterium sp. CCC3.4]MEB0216798.1 group 1 truncated hemoglobin [Undibacterium sp. 5I2]WPX44652.1 group 1 truncated hemoglobin [Undibacterium sp. CCC3.4]